MIYDAINLNIEQADKDFQRLYNHCCQRLKLDNPEIYLFSQSEDSKQAEPANWVFRNGQLVAPANHRHYKGFCRQFNRDIFIRAHLTKQETLLTLSHELYHLWEYKIGKSYVDEDLAEDFAIETYNKIINNKL